MTNSHWLRLLVGLQQNGDNIDVVVGCATGDDGRRIDRGKDGRTEDGKNGMKDDDAPGSEGANPFHPRAKSR